MFAASVVAAFVVVVMRPVSRPSSSSVPVATAPVCVMAVPLVPRVRLVSAVVFSPAMAKSAAPWYRIAAGARLFRPCDGKVYACRLIRERIERNRRAVVPFVLTVVDGERLTPRIALLCVTAPTPAVAELPS
jgi:hypothetical protein